MTTATTTLTGKCPHTGSNTRTQAARRLGEEIFIPREVFLHHAVDVHEEQEKVKHKRHVLAALLKNLNGSLCRSLKNHFDVTYRK